MGILYKRRWKCQYCSMEWKSVTGAIDGTCPECGGTTVKAVAAVPGPVNPRRMTDKSLNLGMDLLLEAQR